MLTQINLHGFKSIYELKELKLNRINVLIGPNGAGKTNLIGFFRMLNWMMTSNNNFQFFLSKYGGANVFLHDGSDKTPQIKASLQFEVEAGINEYEIRLAYAANDTLIFSEERYRFSRTDHPSRSRVPWKTLDTGHKEAGILDKANEGDQTAKTILWLLKLCLVYQFHNTSETARIRTRWPINDSNFLKEDGANLAPYLVRLRDEYYSHYKLIVETIRAVIPFFDDFILDPSEYILLQWREIGSDLIFSSSNASDGTLRIMALITLLLQPEEMIPPFLILDEPELGLHPYAINIVAGLLKSVTASGHVQILVATQSMTLIDYFEPEDIIVVDRKGRKSEYRRLDSGHLKGWLEEYSIAELWEKNVIGGRPSK